MSNKKGFVMDMTQGNTTKLLLKFMIPLVIGNVFQQLYNMVDSMIVGKFVGSDALAAVGATGSVNFLFFSLCFGMSSGIGIIISQQFGAGNEDGVRKTVANAAYIMGTVGLVMSILGVVLAGPVLTFLKTPENICADAIHYMQIICIGQFTVAFYNCVSAILRAVGDSRSPLYFLIVSSVINVALDLLFVRGFKMGVAGAAYATIVSQLIACIGSLIYAFLRNPYFKLEKSQLKPQGYIIRQAVRMGLPLAFQSSLIAISCVALQIVVNGFGSVVVAAFTATSRIEQLVQQPFNSLSTALSTYTGQNIGAGKQERVKKGFSSGLIMIIIFTGVVIPCAWLFGDSIMRWFVSEADVIAFGSQALRITSCFYTFLGIIYVSRGILNGAGDALFAYANGIVEILGRIGLSKPLTLIPAIGVWGIWYATGLTWFLTGVFNLSRYLSGAWKKQKRKVY